MKVEQRSSWQGEIRWPQACATQSGAAQRPNNAAAGYASNQNSEGEVRIEGAEIHRVGPWLDVSHHVDDHREDGNQNAVPLPHFLHHDGGKQTGNLSQM